VAAAGVLVVVALNVVATRGERVVQWDAFQYISLAREFSQYFPNHFGGHFPFGYPLLAAPLVVAGMHPYLALVFISVIAYGILLFVVSSALGRDDRTRELRIFVPALGLIPLMFLLAADAMSEMTFCLLVFLAIVLMTNWARPGAIYLTISVIVAAFAVRYAGIFLLPATVAWVAYDRLTNRVIPVLHAAAGIGIAVCLIAILIYSNVAATGFVSGGPLVSGDHTVNSLIHGLANFGFGAVGVLSEGLFMRLLNNAPVEITIGLLCLFLMVGLAAAALRRQNDGLVAVCGVVVLSYMITIVLLQSVTPFFNPSRYLIPVIAPLFVIVATLLSHQRRVLIGIAAVLCLIAGITAVRGVNSETDADLTSASAFLQPRLGSTTRVLVNIGAMSLASRLDGTIWVGLSGYDSRQGFVFMTNPSGFVSRRGDYVVVATLRYERPLGGRSFEDDWRRYLNARLRSQMAKVVYENHSVIVAQFLR